MVGVVPPKCDAIEEGSGPIGSDFVTGLGECIAEEICVLFACVFYTKIVNNEQKSEFFFFVLYASSGQECVWLA